MMGRPRLPLRGQLLAAFERLNNERGPVTWQDVMTEIPGIHPKSRSDRRMVRNTVESMRRVGELVWQGTRPMSPGKRGRPATLYVVASDWRCFSANAGADLAAMFAGWAKAAR
ncbi:MAG TPA: hypothetical protein PKC59_00915 [Burkholderiaceae bacterium]|nr:hypothetical protein [Burkholderiaceae bacterium]